MESVVQDGSEQRKTATSSVADDREPLSHDPLEMSALLEDILGDAFTPMSMFHVKLLREGVLRGVIGPGDIDKLWERHILNSAAVVPFLREHITTPTGNRIADIGSGGGFPGLVAAACMPEGDFTLVEPMERRVDWLNECITLMQLRNAHVLRARAEEVLASIRRHHVKPFDVVTCRAVAPMKKLAGWTLPLIAPGGALVALKGRSAPVELEKASKQILRNHGINALVKEAPVAKKLDPTHVIIIEKGRV